MKETLEVVLASDEREATCAIQLQIELHFAPQINPKSALETSMSYHSDGANFHVDSTDTNVKKGPWRFECLYARDTKDRCFFKDYYYKVSKKIERF